MSCAYHEASTTMGLITSSSDSRRHHSFLHLPPHSNPFSHGQTPKIILRDTHCVNTPCLRQMYVAAICIPDDLNTSLDAGVSYVLSVVLRDLFPMICIRNITWFTSTILLIYSNTFHNSNLKNITNCNKT